MNVIGLALIVALSALGNTGCADLVPSKDVEPTFARAAVSREKDRLRVTVVVLTEAESKQYFRRPLERDGIQAIWVKVENRNDYPVWMLPRFTDPDYFSPLEVAYVNHWPLSNDFNRKVDSIFKDHAVAWRVAPGATNSGFLFVSVSEGAKYVNIELWHTKGVTDIGFYVELPSGHFDYEEADFAALYSQNQIQELTIGRLRQKLEALPCCTAGSKGGRGDPVNIVLIGAANDVFSALVREGWDPTHALNVGAVQKTVTAFLLGYRYRYSPVSSLYLFDRPQDVAFQKARTTIHQRNHMRLWLSPYTYRGKPVWVGQISRDIGVRFTLSSPSFTTHKIDPEVDDARDYLVQDLLASESLEALGYVKGVGPATSEAPRENLTGDNYFTDGLRAVVSISSRRVDANEIEYIRWEPLPNL